MQAQTQLTLLRGLEYSWVLGSASLGSVSSFPGEVLWKLDSLRGPPIGEQLEESLQTGGQGFDSTFPPLDKVSTTGVRKFLAGKPSQDLQKPL